MDNLDKLVDAVTKEIMRRIEQAEKKKILVLGKDEDRDIADCLQERFTADIKPSLKELQDYDFVVMPAAYVLKMMKWDNLEAPAGECHLDVLDMTGKKLIHERELREKCGSSITTLRIDKKAIITQLAADFIKQRKIYIVRVE